MSKYAKTLKLIRQVSWVPVQAFAAWNWYNFLVSKAPPAKTVLRVNIDETSVCLWQGSGKGTIAFGRRRDGVPEPQQRVPRSLKRTNLTHVAFICDRPEIQPLLPQVIIGNANIFKVGDIRVLNAQAPANVLFVRQRSAWNNSDLFKKTLKVLVDFLGPELTSTLYIVMLFDACRQHLSEETLAYMKTLSLHLCLIPARLTWLLQPLDTHAFQLYKNLLRSIYAEARCSSPTGSLSIVEFSRLVLRVIRQCLQGREWAHAFDADGFGAAQQNISKYVMDQLVLKAPPKLVAHKPSAKELQIIWPRKMPVPYHHVIPRVRAPLALPPAPPPHPALALAMGPPKIAMPKPALAPPPKIIAVPLPASPPKPPPAARQYSSSALTSHPTPRVAKAPPKRRVLPWRPVIPEDLQG